MKTTSLSAKSPIVGVAAPVSAARSARTLFGYRRKNRLDARAIVLTRPDSFLSDMVNHRGIGQGWALCAILLANFLNIFVWPALDTGMEEHAFRIWGRVVCPLLGLASVLVWSAPRDTEHQHTNRMTIWLQGKESQE